MGRPKKIKGSVDLYLPNPDGNKEKIVELESTIARLQHENQALVEANHQLHSLNAKLEADLIKFKKRIREKEEGLT